MADEKETLGCSGIEPRHPQLEDNIRMRLEVCTVVKMQVAIVWAVTPCSDVVGY